MSIKSIYDAFATDAALETQGRWYRIGDQEFLLARAGGSNQKFSAAYSASTRPYSRQQQNGTLSEDVAREILATPFSKHVLLDWREIIRDKDGKETEARTEHTITGKDGQPLRYSADTAKKLLLDIPDLLMTLVDAAGSFSNYKPEELDDVAKNL